MVPAVREASSSDGLHLAKWRLIARQDRLQGVNSSGRVIAWGTDKPLRAVNLEAYRAALAEAVSTVCRQRGHDTFDSESGAR